MPRSSSASCPPCLAIGDGAWDTPDTPITTFLSSQLPLDPAAGDYRVLYVGDPRVLPVPGREYAPGIAFAVVDAGAFDFTDRFTVPHTTCRRCRRRGVAARRRRVDAARRPPARAARHPLRRRARDRRRELHRRGSDPRSRRVSCPHCRTNSTSVRCRARPRSRCSSTSRGSPSAPSCRVRLPRRRSSAGADALVRADLSNAEPAMIGADAWPSATDDVTAGVLHLAIPYDSRLHLTINGTEVASRPSFGVETAFDVDAGGSGVLAYEREASRSLWLAVQAVLWIAVLAVGCRRPGVVRAPPGGDRLRRDVDRPDRRAADLGRCRRRGARLAGLGGGRRRSTTTTSTTTTNRRRHDHDAVPGATRRWQRHRSRGTRAGAAPSQPHAAAPRPRRDTTPPSGIRRVTPTAARRARSRRARRQCRRRRRPAPPRPTDGAGASEVTRDQPEAPQP